MKIHLSWLDMTRLQVVEIASMKAEPGLKKETTERTTSQTNTHA
ncbi:MAG TPA: hypothetical protein VFN95_00120 [Flavitalea sp.]|nr:hypothetical protein [Flavitalea sp.]